MELGKQAARITDYGMTKTKAGAPQVFIRFQVGAESETWYGMPYRKDSDEPNDMCIIQLATCGFDPGSHVIEDFEQGLNSGILITDEDIDVNVKDVTQNDGSLKRRIDSIGEFGPARVSREELSTLISPEKKAKLKAIAGKFTVRKKKVKQDPDETIPF